MDEIVVPLSKGRFTLPNELLDLEFEFFYSPKILKMVCKILFLNQKE